MTSKISMIAAIGRNRELGKGNDLLWKIPDDLKRLRRLTTGHPLIMGRKTFDSIIAAVGRPLPNREHIVVSRDTSWHYHGVLSATTIEDALDLAKKCNGREEIFIFGGAQIYTLALPYADKLYLTLIDDSRGADSFFPEYEKVFTKKVFEEAREFEGLKYTWVDLER